MHGDLKSESEPMTKKPTIDIDDVASAAKKVRESVAALRSRQAELTQRRADLLAVIAALRALPVTRDDARQFIFDTVDVIGAAWMARSDIARALECFAFPRGGGRSWSVPQKDPSHKMIFAPLCLQDIEEMERRGEGGVSSILGDDAYGLTGGAQRGQVGGYCFFFGDLLKKRLSEHFDTLFPERFKFPDEAGAGSSIAERRAEIARAEDELAEVDRQQSEVRQQLSALAVA